MFVAALSPAMLWWGEAGAQGTEFTLNCRADEVLVGINARQGWWINAVAARCRTVNSNGALGSSVRTTDYRGGANGELRSFECGSTEVAVGFSGLQGSHGYVLGIHELLCAPWAADTRMATAPWRAVDVFERKSGSGTWISDICTQGRVGTRLRGRAGAYLDRLIDVGCSYVAGATPPTEPKTQRLSSSSAPRSL